MFGMYTYMPYSGFGYSPFGYTYYSPTTVAYAPTFGGSGYAYGLGSAGVNRYAPTSFFSTTAGAIWYSYLAPRAGEARSATVRRSC